VLIARAVWPLFNVPVPRMVAPSRNVIVPVALADVVAVKVTDWLTVEGLRDDETVTVGVAFPTVTVTEGEVAGLLLASPGVLAVIGSEPSGSVVTVMVATPPMIGAVPIGVEPLEKVTGPDTPGGTVSVIVTGVPKTGLGDDTTGVGNTGVVLLTVCERGADVAELLFVSPP
jgi:hypothetical protein